MRLKKIRGHKRIWQKIDQWVEAHMKLDLDHLKVYQRDYVKIRVHPWSGISLINSQTPIPRGKTKAKILKGLLDIYDSWKSDLDKLGKNYYLKVWLFEPRFSNSQVVCAVGNFLDFYDNTFFKPEKSKELDPVNYGKLKDNIGEFKWEYHLDEEHFDNSELGDPELYETLTEYEQENIRFEKLLEKPHRTTKIDEPIGRVTEIYSFKKGVVWLGDK